MSFQKKPKKEEPGEDWLTTYADAVTLLLCFFIIMFSVSEPQESSFKKIAEALASAGFIDEMAEDPFDVLTEQFEIMIEQNELEKDVAVEETDEGLMLELSSTSFYEPGSARFKPEALPVLSQVAEILHDFDYDAYIMEVEGHTDDLPIKSKYFPSNWELSTARAANVVRFLIADGLTKELMKASGYADTRPKVPNFDEDGNPIPENRYINRRVVIRVERVD